MVVWNVNMDGVNSQVKGVFKAKEPDDSGIISSKRLF